MKHREFIKFVVKAGGFGVARIWNTTYKYGVIPLAMDPIISTSFIGRRINPSPDEAELGLFTTAGDWTFYENKKTTRVAPYEFWYRDLNGNCIWTISGFMFEDDKAALKFFEGFASSSKLLRIKRMMAKEIEI